MSNKNYRWKIIGKLSWYDAKTLQKANYSWRLPNVVQLCEHLPKTEQYSNKKYWTCNEVDYSTALTYCGTTHSVRYEKKEEQLYTLFYTTYDEATEEKFDYLQVKKKVLDKLYDVGTFEWEDYDFQVGGERLQLLIQPSSTKLVNEVFENENTGLTAMFESVWNSLNLSVLTKTEKNKT